MTSRSDAESAALVNSHLLQSLCGKAAFNPGDVLRLKGQQYRDMYLITEGRVDTELDSRGGSGKSRSSGPGSPIGEIGFLRGCAATATVIARTSARALVIDHSTLALLEREQPILTAQFLRLLAQIADERTSSNLTFTFDSSSYAVVRDIDVYLCRNEHMLKSAQQLRYEVYCRELGRNSPYADHERQVIADSLDDAGHTFVAVQGGDTIGTLRINLAREGSLGVLEEVYGMRGSAYHPKTTAICTKFIVTKSKRGSRAAIKLILSVARYAVQNDIEECYIDCIPALLPYYKAMGFSVASLPFFHRENGPSYPMKIDCLKHGNRMSNDFEAFQFLRLYMKAKAIKWLDRLRDINPSVASRRAGAEA